MEIESSLINPIMNQLYLAQACTVVSHSPQTQRKGILSTIVDDSRRDGETSLRSNMRYVFPVLISIYPDHYTGDGSGWGGEFDAERSVEVFVDGEVEGRAVELYAAFGETG